MLRTKNIEGFGKLIMAQRNINQVELVGRVGQEPGIKYFVSGKAKATVTLAVKPPYKSETPMWWELELWEKQAELVASYVHKGSIIAISGELKFDLWVDKNNGLPRSKPVVNVNEIELISSSKRNEESSTPNTSQSPEQDLANANF